MSRPRGQKRLTPVEGVWDLDKITTPKIAIPKNYPAPSSERMLDRFEVNSVS